MRKWLARRLLNSRLLKLNALTQLYAEVNSPEEIAEIQLERFNAHWEYAWRNVPFYTKWREDNDLPECIGSIAALSDFPVLTKKMLSDSRALLEKTPSAIRSTLTGGTSGISTAFPMNGADAESAWTNTHLGRAWNGIGVGDRLFMIWGHSHLFAGSGAWKKQVERRAKDWAANIVRVSAYNLSQQNLDDIAKAILKKRPRYIIGYGSCLLQLCLFLKKNGRNLLAAGVHRVVNTSETISVSDIPLIKEIFGCSVINEYGMAEAGVIGYSRNDLYPVSVFWNDFIVRTHRKRLILTTLGSRCFPLINYDTEDLSDDITPNSGTLLHLNSLLGKARDEFAIIDQEGKRHEVSVVLFDHIFKQVRPLRSLHYNLAEDGQVCVAYTAENGEIDAAILRRCYLDGLAKEGINVRPETVSFTWIESPLQTIAGKRVTLTRGTS